MRLRLHVDLNALRRNYARLNRLSPQCAAVLKANAYGAGAVMCARALWQEGCRFFYTYDIKEALQLRSALPKHAHISFFSGCSTKGEAHEAALSHCIPVLNNIEQYRTWHDMCRTHNMLAPFSLQCDTGMQRSGFTPDHLMHIRHTLYDDDMLPALRYVLHHLACADTPDHPLNTKQYTHVHRISRAFSEGRASFENSSGIYMRRRGMRAQARVGAALYGIKPHADSYMRMPRSAYPETVLSLISDIKEIRHISCDTTVGYGASQTVSAGTVLALLDGGYADGIPYSAGNGRAHCMIEGFMCPVIGRISMDTTIVNITSCQHLANIGSKAVWFSRKVSATLLAERTGMITYTLFANIGPRVRRLYR